MRGRPVSASCWDDMSVGIRRGGLGRWRAAAYGLRSSSLRSSSPTRRRSARKMIVGRARSVSISGSTARRDSLRRVVVTNARPARLGSTTTTGPRAQPAGPVRSAGHLRRLAGLSAARYLAQTARLWRARPPNALAARERSARTSVTWVSNHRVRTCVEYLGRSQEGAASRLAARVGFLWTTRRQNALVSQAMSACSAATAATLRKARASATVMGRLLAESVQHVRLGT